jgi:hypothetical protein
MRLKAHFLKAATLSLAVLVLQACGGGGGGGDPQPSNPGANNGPTVVISGTATYESVTNNNTNGGLIYTAAPTRKPMRGIIVRAVVGNAEVARATTSDTGGYSLTVPQNALVSIQALAQMVNTAGSAKWNLGVYDNTDGGALWGIGSTATSSGTSNSTRNINATLGWNGTNAYNASQRLSGPFAILDTIYTGMLLVTTAQPIIEFPELAVFWSSSNNPTSGSVTLGEIGTSFFAQATNSTGAVTSRVIFILGKENVDTDEFDSGVIAHEYGHYLQSAFSRNHSTGGPHSNGDKLDMTLSYGEGWGYAFASAARNNPQNPDSSGLAQGNGFIIPTGTAPTTNKGWFSEASVQYAIYNLFTTQGFAPIWAAFSGPMRNGQDALNTIFSFAAAVRSAGNAAVNTALNNVLTSQSIFAGASADQWGSGETNDGGNANNLPVHQVLSTAAQSVCFNKDANGTKNKLGGNRYFRFNMPAAGSKTITVASVGADGHNIDFTIYQKGAEIANAETKSTTSEVFTGNFAAGEVLVRAIDFNINTASTTNCATIRIN